VCGNARGRPATAAKIDAILAELAGPDGLTEQASTFARRDVLDQVVQRLPVAASAEQLLAQAERVTDQFLAERAVAVTRDRRLDEPRWTTPELLALEQRLLANATERQQTGCGQVAEPLVSGVLARHSSAGPDQAAMVRDLCRAGDGVAVVVGRAGTGKTCQGTVAAAVIESGAGRLPPCSSPHGATRPLPAGSSSGRSARRRSPRWRSSPTRQPSTQSCWRSCCQRPGIAPTATPITESNAITVG
jgi:hypothetical protein